MAFIILSIVAACAMAFTAFAMVWDIRTRMLPNWLTVPMAAAAFIFHPIAGGLYGDGWLAGLGTAAAGFAVGFGVLLVLWLVGGGGAGDVKMMGALGAWLGPVPTIIIFIGSAITALICTMVLMAYGALTGRKVSMFRTNPKKDAKENKSPSYVPYAVPVTISTWIWMILQLVAAYSPAAS